MSDYPYQITEDTELGRLTFFIEKVNKDMMNSLWLRWFKVTVFYNGKAWYMSHDMSIYDPLIDGLESTTMMLSYCCFELTEYIKTELGVDGQ